MRVDVAIVGGGAAGLSLAAALAPHARVALVERESNFGYHATGRSAAIFSSSYGNSVVQRLSQASLPRFRAIEGVLTHRGLMFVATEAQRGTVQALLRDDADSGFFRPLTVEEAVGRVPILRPDRVAQALYEEAAWDIDVACMMEHWRRTARDAGAVMFTDVDVVARATGDGWRIDTSGAPIEARILVNAAGGWADIVAETAGVRPLGLAALRRTAVTLDVPPSDPPVARWPMVVDADVQFYFKPDAGRIMASPADETPVEPHDCAPDEIDVATAIARIEDATTLKVRRPASRWAGLRTFMPDEAPAIGFDPDHHGFFWLAGQGGFGVQTAPAIAEVAASMMLGNPLPSWSNDDLIAAIAPRRTIA